MSLGSALSKSWQTLSSIKTGVVLIILVVIFSAAGTVILCQSQHHRGVGRALSERMAIFCASL